MWIKSNKYNDDFRGLDDIPSEPLFPQDIANTPSWARVWLNINTQKWHIVNQDIVWAEVPGKICLGFCKNRDGFFKCNKWDRCNNKSTISYQVDSILH